jgi:hypothetical protein
MTKRGLKIFDIQLERTMLFIYINERKKMKILLRIGLFGLLMSTLSFNVFADKPTDVTQMVNMNLEDLLNTKVTSASGREQKAG